MCWFESSRGYLIALKARYTSCTPGFFFMALAVVPRCGAQPMPGLQRRSRAGQRTAPGITQSQALQFFLQFFPPRFPLFFRRYTSNVQPDLCKISFSLKLICHPWIPEKTGNRAKVACRLPAHSLNVNQKSKVNYPYKHTIILV